MIRLIYVFVSINVKLGSNKTASQIVPYREVHDYTLSPLSNHTHCQN